MKNYRTLMACLALLCQLAISHAPAQSEELKLSNLSEIILPEFQAAEVRKDGAVIDSLITDETLWFITNKILWKWNFLDRKVQKISLLQKSDPDVLASLGFDGLNLYVAFTSGIYQFAIKQAKVYKYPFPQSIALRNARFFGFGDSFWLVANDQLNRIDRYGKTIAPISALPQESTKGHAAFDPENKLFWYVTKEGLHRVGIDQNAKPMKVLQLKQPTKSIVAKNGGAIVTTTRTVLITSADGKRLQTIPVEKERKIDAATNDGDQHAYLFNDRTLEAFDLKTQSIGRYTLPFDPGVKITDLELGSGLVHMIADGKIRLFALAPNAAN